jgi:hypothetical protein
MSRARRRELNRLLREIEPRLAKIGERVRVETAIAEERRSDPDTFGDPSPGLWEAVNEQTALMKEHDALYKERQTLTGPGDAFAGAGLLGLIAVVICALIVGLSILGYAILGLAKIGGW